MKNTKASVDDLDRHIRVLGLISVSSYKLWCLRHGFEATLGKSREERAGELAHLEALRAPADPDTHPNHDPRRADRIQRIAAGQLGDAKLTDIDSRVRGLFADVRDVPAAHEALLRLLLQVERYSGLLRCTRGSRRVSRCEGNLVISGLSQLARHHQHWLRPVEDWRPPPGAAGGRGLPGRLANHFQLLVEHLLVHYAVPPCLSGVWFIEDPQEAAIQQGWFLHITSGQNIRTAPGLPFPVTKRAAHLFMTEPTWMGAMESLRWVQIRSIDPDAGRMLAYELSWDDRIRGRRNAEFWTSIVHFFLNNQMLERGYVGPILDYIGHLKFEPRRLPQPDGSVCEAPPLHAAFCVKARSMAKLVREVDAWHERLAVEQVDQGVAWAPSGFGELEHIEDNEPLHRRIRWTIHELRNAALLQYEGRVMGHCVGSYARRCQSGEMSVWSLRSQVVDAPADEDEEAEQKHVLTIAVDNRRRVITQARGRYNLLPNGRKVSRKQARKTDGPYWVALRESARILALWRGRQGLAYAQE